MRLCCFCHVHGATACGSRYNPRFAAFAKLPTYAHFHLTRVAQSLLECRQAAHRDADVQGNATTTKVCCAGRPYTFCNACCAMGLVTGMIDVDLQAGQPLALVVDRHRE